MDEDGIKTVFLGSGSFAPPVLAALLEDDGIRVLEIVTQTDKPAGRKGILTPTPLGQWCIGAGIAFKRVSSVNDPEYLEHLRRLDPDLAVVVSFGQILKEDLLNLPRLGCLNVHASLLPKYRGASPIVSAILNGETRTGVSFMKMNKGLDTGPVYRQLEMAVEDRMTAPELEQALACLAGEKIGGCIRDVASGKLAAVEQDSAAASMSRKIRKCDASLDWNRDAESLSRQIRAFHPWPSTIFSFQHSVRLMTVKICSGKAVSASGGEPGKILSITSEGITVACCGGALLLEKVIPEGKKEMRAVDFANGFRLEPEMILLNGPGISSTSCKGM
ncbi:MAG: methionyl-tRNA formyltransferase [Lentisphaeria bacterium]|nr:methionyl-tRNA formyltransferase [Lentisphaeria bacterium]